LIVLWLIVDEGIASAKKRWLEGFGCVLLGNDVSAL
jgi:hypothetical protein